ncbi:hypothetical protein [Bryobacter aggregatus]|uniref:hypothetical protein n=1 Tax=Bryobacter aggregatus TaxID=360054 RepID=UPI0012BA6DB3|nr:hypothetical protein [Bryobacter aggregatus]
MSGQRTEAPDLPSGSAPKKAAHRLAGKEFSTEFNFERLQQQSCDSTKCFPDTGSDHYRRHAKHPAPIPANNFSQIINILGPHSRFPLQTSCYYYFRRRNNVLPESPSPQVSGFSISTKGFCHANPNPACGPRSSEAKFMRFATALFRNFANDLIAGIQSRSATALELLDEFLASPPSNCRLRPSSPSLISTSVPSKSSKLKSRTRPAGTPRTPLRECLPEHPVPHTVGPPQRSRNGEQTAKMKERTYRALISIASNGLGSKKERRNRKFVTEQNRSAGDRSH